MDKTTYEQLDRIEAKIDFMANKLIELNTNNQKTENQPTKKEGKKNEPRENRTDNKKHDI